MRQELEKELRELYSQIYGEKEAEQLLKDVDELIKNSPRKNTKQWLTQKDAVLITYGDSIIDKEEPGLKVLNDFLKKHVADAISIVHILPMFPTPSAPHRPGRGAPTRASGKDFPLHSGHCQASQTRRSRLWSHIGF